MLNFFSNIPTAMEFIIVLAAFFAAVFAIYKTVYLPLRKHFDRVNRGMDTLLGYPAVLDPGSGREIQAPTPPLAQRVYDLEGTSKEVAAALTVMAQNQQHLVELQTEMDIRKQIGQEIIDDFTVWREKVDDRLSNWVVEQDQLAKTIRDNLEGPS